MDEFPWIERYRPWGASPISFLEIQFLAEVGRLEARVPELVEAVGRDARFVIDEVPLVPLIEHALPVGWTRDPFDRLLVAHSSARRAHLCTLDRRIRASYPLVVPELAVS